MEKDMLIDKLSKFSVEVPSWGFARSGTRFHSFHIPGEARTLNEKIEDAGIVAKLTGAVSSVAIHIPWDKSDDYEHLKKMAREVDLKIGAVNPNLFQEEEYLFGSLSNSDSAIRRKAIDHCLECIDIMKKTDSKALSLWLPDGSNYPGQTNMVKAFERLIESLKEIYIAMDDDMLLLIEYKFFEPAFYHTVLSDWGTAMLASNKLGERAKILVDLGHHPQGTNIEYIVGLASMEGKLGGFHFNSRKYADDDLTVGSMNPYELFLIFVQLNEFFDLSNNEISLVIDQSHNVKSKIKAMIQSVTNLQKTYARSLLVDYEALEEARNGNDVVSAEEILKRAFESDVREIMSDMRSARSLPENPLEEFSRKFEGKLISKRG